MIRHALVNVNLQSFLIIIIIFLSRLYIHYITKTQKRALNLSGMEEAA